MSKNYYSKAPESLLLEYVEIKSLTGKVKILNYHFFLSHNIIRKDWNNVSLEAVGSNHHLLEIITEKQQTRLSGLL